MSVKSFVGAAKKQDAKKALSKRPILVLFYMIGCSHCAANKPAWDEAKKRVDKDTEVLEIEADAVPDDEGVTGFPTMRHVDKDGKKKETTGEKKSGEEIEQELELGEKKGGLRRRRTRRRVHSRRNRKLRHRTLRHNVSLRK
jgi:hypothetical protein